jgi:hypothetical protein
MKLPAESSHPFWFYIYGFNMIIIAGLFAGSFGRAYPPFTIQQPGTESVT